MTNIIPLLPRQRAADAKRAYDREGVKLKYTPRVGVRAEVCNKCREIIRHGRCGCPEAA